jgi:hypothetical protein
MTSPQLRDQLHISSSPRDRAWALNNLETVASFAQLRQTQADAGTAKGTVLQHEPTAVGLAKDRYYAGRLGLTSS